jgi:hypothetical protein
MKRYKLDKTKMHPSDEGLWVLYEDAKKHLMSLETRQQLRLRSIKRNLIILTYYEEEPNDKNKRCMRQADVAEAAKRKYMIDPIFNSKVNIKWNILMRRQDNG